MHRVSGYNRIGLVEVGSRSVRYLVADFDANSNFSPVSIANHKHGIDPLSLSEADCGKINRIIETTTHELSSHSCDRSFVYGTEICRKLQEMYPSSITSDIHILTNEEEALAAWAAGLLCETNVREPITCTVIDQGNGSTEVVKARWDGSKISDVRFAGFELGSAELLQRYRSSPNEYLPFLIKRISSISKELSDLNIKNDGSSQVYLAGGVATKIAWINVRENEREHYKPHKINGAHLTVPYLLTLYSRLSAAYTKSPKSVENFIDSRRGSEDETPRVISSAPFLAKLRADVALGDDLYVTGYGVRHGMAFLMSKSLL